MGMGTQKEVKITYETLYEIARREKNREEMQKLPDNFVVDVLSYLKQKEQIAQDSKKRFDLFSATEREKTETQLRNIRKLLKELYEKRESKILNMALNKSRTNTNLIDMSSLLSEERILFDALVLSLNNGRDGIVRNILQGKMPQMVKRRPGPPQTISRRIGETLNSKRHIQNKPHGHVSTIKQQENASGDDKKDGASIDGKKEDLTDSDKPLGDPDQPQVTEQKPDINDHPGPEVFPKPPKSKIKSVRFTDDVPKFIGAELEEYGPFTKDEQKNLPQDIADVLISAGKAVAV